MTDAPKKRGRPPKTPTVSEMETLTQIQDDEDFTIPHHPPITADGFRDEALQQWLIEYYPDLANLAITGRITNHTQP